MNIRKGMKFFDDEYEREEWDKSKMSGKRNMYSKIEEFRNHYKRDPDYKDLEYMARLLYPEEDNVAIDLLVAIYYDINLKVAAKR